MTVRKYDSLKAMKAEEYRYWQSRPVHERMEAVSELTLALYSMKGPTSILPRHQWPVERHERQRNSAEGNISEIEARSV